MQIRIVRLIAANSSKRYPTKHKGVIEITAEVKHTILVVRTSIFRTFSPDRTESETRDEQE